MKKTSIALVGQGPPSTGGIATNIMNLMSSPLQENYRYIFFQVGSRKYGREDYFKEKIVTKLLRAGKEVILYMVFLVKVSPKIAHVNTSFAPFSFWRDAVFVVLSKIARKKVLLQIHGGRLDEFIKNKPILIKFMIKSILKMPSQITVLSKMQEVPFKEMTFPQRVKVVPNMIDAGKFTHRKKPHNNLHVPAGFQVVLFVTPIFYRLKGVWDILCAVPFVLEKHENTLFLFVGGDGEESSLRESISEKKLQQFVRFTGRLFGNDLIDAYSAADVLILPSYSEGFPLVVLEGMAVGLPIVATPVGAIPEIIEDGKNGFLIPPGDSKLLAEKINCLLEDEALRRDMGEKNRQIVNQKYDIKPVAQIFHKIYSELG